MNLTRRFAQTRLASICGFIALICVSGAAEAQMYKCVVDGKTVYQQEACAEGARETKLRGAPPPPSSATEVKAADEKSDVDSKRAYELIVDVTTAYNLCVEYEPDFAATFGNTFNAWAAGNQAAYKIYNANPNGPAEVRRRMDISRARTAGDDIEARAKRAAICARLRGLIE